MPTNPKLSVLADQILKTLDQLTSQDPQTQRVRAAVLDLAEAMGADIPDSVMRGPHAPPERANTPPQTPDALRAIGFQRSSFPPAQRPGLSTERRASRQLAGVTLKQVAQAAHTTLPTVRMYEAKRTAVRPDKRATLDHIYAEFTPKDQIK